MGLQVFIISAKTLKTAFENSNFLVLFLILDMMVFIESDIGAADKVEGLSQIGTARAYTTTHDGCLITAVGDVPERTARMIALSVRPVR
jgi:negative regulator of sigma E activity